MGKEAAAARQQNLNNQPSGLRRLKDRALLGLWLLPSIVFLTRSGNRNNTKGPPEGGLPIFFKAPGSQRSEEIMNARIVGDIVYVLPENEDGTLGQEYTMSLSDYKALLKENRK